MNIEEILEALEDMLEEGLPLMGKCVIDKKKARQLLEDIRLNMPNEIKQAQMIVNDRSDIIAQSEKQAEEMIRKAEERAKALIAQEEITKQAQEKAKEIITQAQTMAKELKKAANDFSDNALKQSEDSLVAALKNIHETRQQLASALKAGNFADPQQNADK